MIPITLKISENFHINHQILSIELDTNSNFMV